LRYVVFSDVHGNLDALDAVLDHASEWDPGYYLCLGDVVGYGANPNECVERLTSLPNCACLKGNHDAAVVDEHERTFFHEVALEGIRFTERELTEDNRAFLRNLPYTFEDGKLMAVHASPYRPEAWEYVLDQTGASRAFLSMGDRRVAFIGHSHAPVVFSDDGVAERFIPGDSLELDVDLRRYVINVGSVGQPRDGNPDASYVTYDDEARSVKIHRVQYDREKAAEKILKAGLPPVLAERLLVGY
jgi:diadenosine tetraphosphatase ApaH/serine/threonine PP2A family protein phosphatase